MSIALLDPKTRQHEVVDDITRRGLLRVGAVTGTGLALGTPLLSACSAGGRPAERSTAKPPSKPTGLLRIANNGEPTSLDPTLGATAFDFGILFRNVYESLVQFRGDTTELEGMLAESVDSSPDAKEWAFRLRKGVTFHDGEPLTSSAVKASFEYYLNNPGSWAGGYVPKGATFDESDPLVLRVTSSTPMPDLARNLNVVQIISPKVLKAGKDAVAKTPTGTGPFRFVSYTTSEQVVVEANPDYYGAGPYLERLEFPIIPQEDGRLAALRSGGVDVATLLPPTHLASLRADSSLVVVESHPWVCTWMHMYCQTPPMDNVKVRQALAYAIDRPAILKAVLNGAGSVDDSWVATGVYGSQEPETTYPYDLERAKQLMAESGAADTEIVLGFTAQGHSHERQSAQAIAGMAQKAGINLTAKAVQITDAVKINNMTGQRPWHAYISGALFYTGAAIDLLVTPYFGTGLQLDDPTLDDLSGKVLATPDGPERLAIFGQIEERVAQLRPNVKIYNRSTFSAHRSTVQGFKVSRAAFANYGETYLAG